MAKEGWVTHLIQNAEADSARGVNIRVEEASWEFALQNHTMLQSEVHWTADSFACNDSVCPVTCTMSHKLFSAAIRMSGTRLLVPWAVWMGTHQDNAWSWERNLPPSRFLVCQV